MVFFFALFAAVLWQDPGDIGALDFSGTMQAGLEPPGAPYTFVREDLSGTQPKFFVRDTRGVEWNVKFGYEVKTESFAWRIARACGYFAEPSFYVASGKFEGMGQMRRASPWLKPDGTFTAARFQFRDPAYRFVKDAKWRWDRRPFAGTPQLSGLKILIMLVSNWDNKDGRAPDPNTALFEHAGDRVYAFTDWGSGMGKWGDRKGQTDWRCEDFTAQTPRFVRGVRRGRLVFGWGGVIDDGFQRGIPVAHASWLLKYLGRITDVQMQAGLRAAGSSDAEAVCFASALRSRIDQLKAACKKL